MAYKCTYWFIITISGATTWIYLKLKNESGDGYLFLELKSELFTGWLNKSCFGEFRNFKMSQ